MTHGRASVADIAFVDPGPLVDGALELRLVETIPADHTLGFEPTYSFAMVDAESGAKMGTIRLRVGHSEHLTRYRGHIGFGVDEPHRGQRFAARSCQLLARLVRHHSMAPVSLTCDEHNLASQRTMELIGAEFIGVVTMPDDYPYAEYYAPASRTKRRYQWTPR